MKRKNTTRKALITSIISVLLCVSMLVGTTFAWFTDTVESGRNVIAAGNLDVELYHSDKNETGVKVNGSTKLFNDVVLWEPGAVLYDTLQVKNVGSLALKYQIDLTVLNETVVNGYKLSDVIMVGVIDSALGTGTTREGIVGAVSSWTKLSEFTLSKSSIQLEVGGEDTFTVVLYWQPNSNEVDNRYNMNNENQGKQLNLEIGVNLYATQVEAENDSFDNTYDENAWHDAMVVTSASELSAALANSGAVKLGADIALTAPVTVPAGVTVALNLNGKTISGSVAKTDGHVIDNDGTLTLVGGAVASTADNGGSAIKNDGTLTVQGTTVTGAPQSGDSSPSYAINSNGDMTIKDAVITSTHGAISVANGAKVTIDNTDVTVNGFGGSSHVFYIGGSGTEVVVNSGTYTHKGNVDGSLAYIMTGSSLTVNGGSFSASNGGYGLAAYKGGLTVNGGTFANAFQDWGGPISITGGTFKTEPAAKYIAEGNHAIKVNGEYHVVPTGTVNAVAEANTLLAGGANADVVLFGAQDPNGIVTIPASYTGTLTLKDSTLKSVQAEDTANLVIAGNVVINAYGDGIATVSDSGDSASGVSAITGKVLNITGTGADQLIAVAAGDYAYGIGGNETTGITVENIHIVDVRGGHVQPSFIYDASYGKEEPTGGAAIGSGTDGAVITLNNVTIDNAQGGSKAAGIGARYWTGVTININNSTIKNVEGGNASAGIGGSRVAEGATTVDNVTINISNSTVKAVGGQFGAGIGSGYNTYCAAPGPIHTINISGNSVITAQGGKYAAGIGTGYHVAGLDGVIESTVTVNATAGESREKYTVAQDVGFGVVDHAREAKDNNCSINYGGTEIGIPGTQISSADALNSALESGGNVILTQDVETEAEAVAPYGNKVGFIQNGGVLDGNGKTLSVECYGDDYGVMTSGGTIKNLTIDSGCRAIMIMSPTEDIIIDNVYVCGDILYPINTGEHATVEGIDLIVTSSTFGGWSSFAGIASASFTGCTFIEGEYGYGWPYETLVKPYVTTTFTSCEFAPDGDGNGYYLDLSALGADCTVTLTNCTVNGTVITAENCTTLFGEVELPSGRTLADCVIFN